MSAANRTFGCKRVDFFHRSDQSYMKRFHSKAYA